MDQITRGELLEMMHSHDPFFLIDVRSNDELKHGMIFRARHIALDELKDALGMDMQTFKARYGFPKPAKDEVIVFYCRTGGRSQVATDLARSLGFDARNYKGSVKEWSQYDDEVEFYQ